MSGTVFIALYRGINVGGNNPAKMADLRAMHQSLGHEAVKTYVQSGNVVFHAVGTASAVASGIAKAFSESFGFDATVMVRSKADWDKFVAGNPYEKEAAADPAKVHAAICDGTMDSTAIPQVGNPALSLWRAVFSPTPIKRWVKSSIIGLCPTTRREPVPCGAFRAASK